MILMDKMKDQSCGIKPVFGFGDGLDLPNLGFMFEPVLNVAPAPIIPPFYFAQPFNQPALYLGPGLAFIPGIDPPLQQVGAGNAANITVPSSTVTAQANVDTNVVGHQPHLSIAEIIYNAAEQHIATHQLPNMTGIVVNESNVHQPGLNVAEIVTNAVQPALLDVPLPGLHTLNTNDAHQGLTNVHASTFTTHDFHQYTPGTTNYLSHVTVTGHSSNHVAAAQPSQQSTSEMSTNEQFLLSIDEETAAESINDFDNPPMNFYSGVIYNISSVPFDDESNFSNPAFHAPVSSPVHHYPFNASDDDDSVPAINQYNVSSPVHDDYPYTPASPSYSPCYPFKAPDDDDDSVPAINQYNVSSPVPYTPTSPPYSPSLPSNIIDSAENSDNVNENQISNPDVLVLTLDKKGPPGGAQ